MLQAHAVAVARAIGLPIDLKRLQPTGLLRYLPVLLRMRVSPSRLLASSLDGLDWPRVVIAAGRKSIPVALAIKSIAPIPVFALNVRLQPRWGPRFDMLMTRGDSTAGFDATYNVPSTSARGEQSSNDSLVGDIEIVADVIRRAIGVQGTSNPDSP
jgi:mitochondrial fission protein ELM1